MSQPTNRLLRYDAVFSERAVQADANGLYKFRLTTEVADSHDSVLKVAGCDLTRFRMNPVVVIDDDNSVEAICGTCESIEIVADPVPSIDVMVRFAQTDNPDDAGNLCLRLAQAGCLRGMSHFFRCIEVREGSQISDAERLMYGLSRYGYIIEKWELRAASIVAVGSNPLALKRAVSDGVITEAQAKRLAKRTGKRQDMVPVTGDVADGTQTPTTPAPPDQTSLLMSIATDLSSISERIDEVMAYLAQINSTDAIAAALVRIEGAVKGMCSQMANGAAMTPDSTPTQKAVARIVALLDQHRPAALNGGAAGGGRGTVGGTK